MWNRAIDKGIIHIKSISTMSRKQGFWIIWNPLITRIVVILQCFSHGILLEIRCIIIASCMATNGVEIKWMVTHWERSKAISDVAGHILHSFCAGDHGFKGIVGSFLIKSFFTGHSNPWHSNVKQRFWFLQIPFQTTPIKLQHRQREK